MQIKPPGIGKIYVSSTDKSLVVYVVDITKTDDDAGFTVEGCDPAYKDDAINADGFEITADVWEKHDFTLLSE